MASQFLWRDPDGVNRWHDHRKPHGGYKNDSNKCGTNAWSPGLLSDACGVHENQVAEFREDVKAHGFTGVEFTNSGDCVFTSRRERARYLQHRGLHDRDAGYGD